MTPNIITALIVVSLAWLLVGCATLDSLIEDGQWAAPWQRFLTGLFVVVFWPSVWALAWIMTCPRTLTPAQIETERRIAEALGARPGMTLEELARIGGES